MSSIPSDLYDRVFQIATDLTNASEAGDDMAYGASYAQLTALYEERTQMGLPHPFLPETLADYTDDAAKSASLYRLAIEQAATFADEPTHAKHIGLAEALISLGRKAEAREHLDIGQRQARSVGDSHWVDHAAELSRSLVA
jgi:hypothetical protein